MKALTPEARTGLRVLAAKRFRMITEPSGTAWLYHRRTDEVTDVVMVQDAGRVAYAFRCRTEVWDRRGGEAPSLRRAKGHVREVALAVRDWPKEES